MHYKLKQRDGSSRPLAIAIAILFAVLTLGVFRSPAEAAITNGMNASDVLGQLDFVSNGDGLSLTEMNLPAAVLADTVNDRLYVADTQNNRVLSYDLNADGTLVDTTPDNVLGKADFVTDTPATTQSSLNGPYGLAMDENNNYLFVGSGGPNANNRVMVFDVADITDGENAVFVLGQTDFVSNGFSSTQSTLKKPMALAYDNVNERLFVGDRDNHRVLVFDMSSGIANGMNASNVLGQVDFLDNSTGTSATEFDQPRGLAYDEVNERLFVGDRSNARVLVFDLSSGVTNNMAASNVLGQPDFSSTSTDTTQDTFGDPVQVAYNSAEDQLYVADQFNSRVMVFDTATITDGENAAFVLGQTDFVTETGDTTQSTLSEPQGVGYNPIAGDVIVADRFNNRVVIYDAFASDIDQDGTDDATDTDDDGDGIDDSVEDGFPNGGDSNGDGTADSQQDTVSANDNPVTGAHTAIESSNQTCTVSSFTVQDEASLAVQDPSADYPVGLNDFTFDCGSAGATATVVVYYDQDYDTSLWSYKKYDDVNDTYTDITSSVTFGTADVGGTTVTTVTYDITDGGALDQDGVADGVITDPAGPGDDGGPTIPDCNGQTPTIVGTEGDDVLQGTSGVDVIVGLGGNDIIEGKKGNDVICGGEGDDIIRGGKGNDAIFGEAGHDTLLGNADGDTLVGGDGDDIVKGGSGIDSILGDSGADILKGGADNDTLSGNGGDDVIKGGAGGDTMNGNGGDDIMDGRDGDDTINGNGGDNIIDGANDIDTCSNGLVINNCEL